MIEFDIDYDEYMKKENHHWWRNTKRIDKTRQCFKVDWKAHEELFESRKTITLQDDQKKDYHEHDQKIQVDNETCSEYEYRWEIKFERIRYFEIKYRKEDYRIKWQREFSIDSADDLKESSHVKFKKKTLQHSQKNVISIRWLMHRLHKRKYRSMWHFISMTWSIKEQHSNI